MSFFDLSSTFSQSPLTSNSTSWIIACSSDDIAASSSHDSVFLCYLSDIIGWGYFFAWSISFWPQTILNFKRKKVSGLSLEFLCYNITGFIFYSIYNTITFVVEKQTPNATETVFPNDLAFAYHAVLLTLITIIQAIVYKTKRHKVHFIHSIIVLFIWLLLLYNIILCILGYIPWYQIQTTDSSSSNSNPGRLLSYSLIDFMAYSKVFITLVKYIPQAYLNYKRKSTVGWSIMNILLDFTGGTLSLGQQSLDSYRFDSLSPFGNVAKFLLACISIAFDILFMIQHYILYTDHSEANVNLPEEDDSDDDHQQDPYNHRSSYRSRNDPDDIAIEDRRSSYRPKRNSLLNVQQRGLLYDE